MDDPIPDKSYFRIGEVSKILRVQPYVVRYWESEFKTVRPIRTRSDQRLYRRKDLEELLTIKRLLYEENFTINGARKQLRKLRNEDAFTDASVSPSVSSDGRNDILLEIEKGLRQIRDMVS